jgi:hypothetical protein
MKIAVMQPYLFPYIGYFQLINAVDKFVILEDVNYINRGWINRNRVLINGKPQFFSIPLREASQNKLINEIEIVNDQRWRVKLIRTLQYNYKKAPFFHDVFPLIEKIILNEELNVSTFIFTSLIDINFYLEIDTFIEHSSAKYNTKHLKAERKIVDICIQEKATTYINPIGGAELYSKQLFKDNNIDLFFLKTEEIIYDQNCETFIPWLSIIDVMMFNSVDRIRVMLDDFDLI